MSKRHNITTIKRSKINMNKKQFCVLCIINKITLTALIIGLYHFCKWYLRKALGVIPSYFLKTFMKYPGS